MSSGCILQYSTPLLKAMPADTPVILTVQSSPAARTERFPRAL